MNDLNCEDCKDLKVEIKRLNHKITLLKELADEEIEKRLKSESMLMFVKGALEKIVNKDKNKNI